MTSKSKTKLRETKRVAFTFSAAAESSIGRVRKNNEDADFVNPETGLFIVSDGMGGAQAGEVAASLVTTILPKMIEARLCSDTTPSGQRMRAWLLQDMLTLSRKIYVEGNGNPMVDGMGATVVAVLARGDRVSVAHMGDSRAYLFRRQRLLQLTNDHSVVSLLLRSGEITEAQAHVHPARGHLTRFVGMKDEVLGDVRSILVRHGDRLLLCTDGLTGMLSDAEIAQLLGLYPSAVEASKRLVEAANDAGGKDNVTALVVDIARRQDVSCQT